MNSVHQQHPVLSRTNLDLLFGPRASKDCVEKEVKYVEGDKDIQQKLSNALIGSAWTPTNEPHTQIFLIII